MEGNNNTKVIKKVFFESLSGLIFGKISLTNGNMNKINDVIQRRINKGLNLPIYIP